MNFRVMRNIIGKIMILLSIFMILPLIVSLVYKEGLRNYLAFLIPGLCTYGIGYLLSFKKNKDIKMGAKEGFIIVGFSWIVISLIACVPFIINKDIPNFFNAFFETVSGFTTTGASVIDVTKVSNSTLFWRSFLHWIGGMGVLVFILAVIPESSEGSSMHILRAESPGPQVGKLVSKMKLTSRYLYLIYLGLTLIEFLLLYLGPDKEMKFFNSLIYSLGTAGTGGFSMDPYGLEFYGVYSQYVISIFMFIFGINFNVFYLILIKKFSDILKMEEVRAYFIIIIVATILIALDIMAMYENFGEALRYSFFQVSTVITTTGFTTANFAAWPTFAKIILLFLMVIGACAGSTAGGFKISRMLILSKSSVTDLRKMLHPRQIIKTKLGGDVLSEETIRNTKTYLVAYVGIIIASVLLISIEGYGGIETNLSAVLACFNNIGPGLELVGPLGNYSGYSNFSTLVLTINMLAGRLEIFPILLLFTPTTWRKN